METVSGTQRFMSKFLEAERDCDPGAKAGQPFGSKGELSLRIRVEMQKWLWLVEGVCNKHLGHVKFNPAFELLFFSESSAREQNLSKASPQLCEENSLVP